MGEALLFFASRFSLLRSIDIHVPGLPTDAKQS